MNWRLPDGENARESRRGLGKGHFSGDGGAVGRRRHLLCLRSCWGEAMWASHSSDRGGGGVLVSWRQWGQSWWSACCIAACNRLSAEGRRIRRAITPGQITVPETGFVFLEPGDERADRFGRSGRLRCGHAGQGAGNSASRGHRRTTACRSNHLQHFRRRCRHRSI